MKKALVLCTLALAATSVYGNESSDQTRLFQYDFNCDFGSHNEQTEAIASPDVDQRHDARFRAKSVVFAYGRNMEHPVTSTERANFGLDNLLYVTCNDKPIFSGTAVLDSEPRFVQIAASNGTLSVVALRPHQDGGHDGDDRTMKYEAFLNINGKRVPGHCDLTRTEVENHHENNDHARVSQ
jgi:hypothetical protein